ncbi:MAG: hypothetical protein ACKV0T_23160 [Planctomycetales bacterium]
MWQSRSVAAWCALLAMVWVAVTARQGADTRDDRSDDVPLATGPGHRDHPSGTLYGHTSPVYVDVAERPIDARTQAREFIAWIDRLSVDLRVRHRVQDEAQRRRIAELLEAARAVYSRLAESAPQQRPSTDSSPTQS